MTSPESKVTPNISTATDIVPSKKNGKKKIVKDNKAQLEETKPLPERPASPVAETHIKEETPSKKPKKRTKPAPNCSLEGGAELTQQGNRAYTDPVDGVHIPKRLEALSNLYEVYCVRHNEPINIADHEIRVVAQWSASVAARDACVHQLLKIDKKATGRRDVYVRERGKKNNKCGRIFAYTIRRRRVAPENVKKVQFPGKEADAPPAAFNFNVTRTAKRVNKQHIKEFKQQIMRRLGMDEEEINAVHTDKESPVIDKKTGKVVPDSDSEEEEDL